MIAKQVIDLISPLNDSLKASRLLDWLTDLGFQMTISARSGYPNVENKIEHLVAFNELQHQLYCYIRRAEDSKQERIEVFLEGLREYAEGLGVAGDFGWALQTSLRSLTSTSP